MSFNYPPPEPFRFRDWLLFAVLAWVGIVLSIVWVRNMNGY